MKGYERFIIVTVLLSVASLFFEQADFSSVILQTAGNIIDYVLMASVVGETIYDIVSEKYRRRYFRENWLSFLFTIFFTLLFCYSKFVYKAIALSSIAVFAALIRSLFLALRMYSRMKRLRGYVEKLTTNPAQTILLSFAAVIFAGTLFLMMGFTAVDGKGLSFLNALFTSASCVCVTGLTVVDTVSYFTFRGQLVLLILIQTGGLGIMLLSYFTIYVIRRRVSLADKLMLSYMLSDDDTAGIYKSMLSIVLTTLSIEGVGAVLLFCGFVPSMGFTGRTVWYAVFHSVSAFCNAGFALFSNSLEGFRHNTYIMFVFAFLIISGGIGFSCITNIRAVIDSARLGKRGNERAKLTLNTKVVITGTAVLLLAGTLLFYILEYSNTMKDYSLGEQYLASFFQSVTFRTAGFNSVPFASLRPATYLLFCIFMVIGAASGSTAGGMKINTAAVLGSALYSYLKGEKHYRIGRAEIADAKIFQACIIFTADILCIVLATVVLSAVCTAPVERIIFEVCSAVGTVGVTSGLTPGLPAFAKFVLILLMYWGRVGALTVLSSAAPGSDRAKIRWPQADIAIG
ncbi:MAG: TrkH family potassium uptake protein [Treponema sp.]|nr:TrkH family potassium uptake protein [Treponema sp.]